MVTTSSQADAQGLPALEPAKNIGLPSSGSILQNNPILTAPPEPPSTGGPRIEGERVAPPAESSADEERIHVARVMVDNVPDALRQKVDAVVAPYRDREMTLTDLRNVAVQVTEVMLDNGESISYAYVPRQDIVDGVVRLNILRGHVESITLKRNGSLVRDSTLQTYLDSGVSPSGDVQTAERQLARMSDLPGVGEVRPVLSPGQTAGGTVLTVDAEAGPRVEGALVLDNAGSSTSGRNRIGAQININSPLGLGDRFQAVLYGAPDLFQFNHDSDGGYTVIGRVSYDLPVGLRGARAGIAVSRVNYALGGDYDDLGYGYATVYSLYGSYPLVRARSFNLDFGANLDYKRISDTLIDGPNQRSAPVLSAQFGGDNQSRLMGLPNVLQYQVGVTGGDLHNDDDWNGAKTRGTYLKTTQYAKLTQGLIRGVYLDLSVNAQQASHNLDGSEKMVLGGPNAVRAYSSDTVSADSGYVASIQLNVAVPLVSGLTTQVFYDRAQATVQKFVRRGRNSVTMEGYGFGFHYVIRKRASFSLAYATRAGSDSLLGDQHKSMAWVSTVVRF
jgi:hemolysin activation/secretion protein